MSEIILLIFEGEKTELQIFKSIERHFLAEYNIRVVPFRAHIYALYKKILDDELGEFLDIVGVLKEDPDNLAILEDIFPENVSQVYLFFDYDGHVPGACNERILELLQHFNEETENGKLYISYPMVEALKHLTIARQDFQLLCADIVDVEPNTSTYKRLAHEEGDACFRDFANLSLENWVCLLGEHCKKANYVVNDQFVLPATSIPVQVGIYQKQLDCHIDPHRQVAVLSAFPLFLAEYHGAEWLITTCRAPDPI